MCTHIRTHTLALATYLEPQLFLIVYSAFLPFFCCSLIHFSSVHWGCVSRAAGTALCKDIVLLLCARTARTHKAHTHTNSQMHGEDTCACTSHTHKQSSRVNEVLEFLKATPSQRQTLFYSSSHPSVLPSFLTSSRQFCMWVLSSLLPPFTWLSSLRSELDSNPLSATHRSTEPPKNGKWIQYTWSMFQLVSS